MSRQQLRDLCHNLTEASSLPISCKPIILTSLERLKISQDQDCTFYELLLDIVNTQIVPEEDVHISLEKLSAEDLCLFIFGDDRVHDP